MRGLYIATFGQPRDECCTRQREKCPSSLGCLCRRNLESLPNYRTLSQLLARCTGCHSLRIQHIHNKLKAMFFFGGGGDKSKYIQHSKSNSINSQAHDTSALRHAVFVNIIHRFSSYNLPTWLTVAPALPKPVCAWATIVRCYNFKSECCKTDSSKFGLH
jgi:hypothetical protein